MRWFWVLVHRYAELAMAFFLIVAGLTGSVERSYFAQDENSEFYYTALELIGHFHTWGLRHTTLLGSDRPAGESAPVGRRAL